MFPDNDHERHYFLLKAVLRTHLHDCQRSNHVQIYANDAKELLNAGLEDLTVLFRHLKYHLFSTCNLIIYKHQFDN